MVEGYFAGDRKYCVVVQIIDMRHDPTEQDLTMIDFLSHNRLPFIVVLTKKDKLNKTQQQKQMNLFSEIFSDFDSVPVFPFSALKGDGKEEILSYLESKIDEYSIEEEM